MCDCDACVRASMQHLMKEKVGITWQAGCLQCLLQLLAYNQCIDNTTCASWLAWSSLYNAQCWVRTFQHAYVLWLQ
jgi:hypothetical protein